MLFLTFVVRLVHERVVVQIGMTSYPMFSVMKYTRLGVLAWGHLDKKMTLGHVDKHEQKICKNVKILIFRGLCFPEIVVF